MTAAPTNGAWVTLLTQPGYLPGVRTLRASLARSGTAYPLLVLVTDAIDAAVRRVLEDDGCQVREVEPVRPGSRARDGYANARFAEVWTKLAVWGLTELDRAVFLDADMLVVAPMDELFTLELAPGSIAACHACRCNPNRIASYPAGWTPERCAYTYQARGEAPPESLDDYLNGGLLVLTPDADEFDDLARRVAALEDLTPYPFAEQDFLNEIYRDHWQPLPYTYNALKTLPFQHPGLWRAADVKNIHFIIDKPWQGVLDPAERYAPLHQLWWDVAAGVPAPVSVVPES